MSIAGCNKNGAAHLDVSPEITRTAHAPLELTPAEGQVIVYAAGAAQVDEKSGKVCWPAMTCTLDDCPSSSTSGEPYVFPFKLEGTTVGADGAIVWPNTSPHEREKWAHCPVCKNRDGVRPYEPPQVVERRAYLLAELARSRAAFRSAGKQTASNHRTPQTILDEISDLPQVFLIDDGRFDSLGN